jgi:CDGSH-type Zn-finger protein
VSEPHVAQKGPYIVDEKARRVAWCQCGLSASQPYCDGAHKTTEFRPIIIDLTEDKKVAWCGCKHSRNKPYCDGTHKTI